MRLLHPITLDGSVSLIVVIPALMALAGVSPFGVSP
jgi:hypothetical protein